MEKFQFGKYTSNAHRRNIPYSAIVGHLIADPRASGRYVPMVSAQTFESSIINIRADLSGVYQNTACVGMETIFRPFSVYDYRGDPAYTSNLPHMEYVASGPPSGLPISNQPLSGIFTPPAFTSTYLNPFISQNDFEWTSYGATYSGIHQRKNPDADLSTARGIAFRAPMMLCGWGYGLNGMPVPNIVVSGTHLQDYSGVFRANTFVDSSHHKVGPVDLLWDDIRKVWMSPGTMLYGKLEGDLGVGTMGRASGAMMSIFTLSSGFIDQDTGHDVRVFNRFSVTVSSGTYGFYNYDSLTSKWWIIGKDC
jgi:hypothetical protein